MKPRFPRRSASSGTHELDLFHVDAAVGGFDVDRGTTGADVGRQFPADVTEVAAHRHVEVGVQMAVHRRGLKMRIVV
jgi:hypothetical protein